MFVQCFMVNYRAIFIRLLSFLSVGLQPLIQITTDTSPCNALPKKTKSFGMCYPASAGICHDGVFFLLLCDMQCHKTVSSFFFSFFSIAMIGQQVTVQAVKA